MRRVGEVEDLDLLGDGIAYGHGEVVGAVAVGLVVEQILQRHYGRIVIGHFDAHRVAQGHDPDALSVEGKGDVLLQLLDVGNLDARGGIHLVEGNGRAHLGLDIHHLDLVIGQGRADLVVVPRELFGGDIPAGAAVVLEYVDRREFVPGEAVGGIQAVVERLELFDFAVELVIGDDLESPFLLLLRFLHFLGLGLRLGSGLRLSLLLHRRGRDHHSFLLWQLLFLLELRHLFVHLFLGGFFLLLLPAFSQMREPDGETPAAENQPAKYEQGYGNAREYAAYQGLGPADYRGAATSAESGTEDLAHAGEGACESQCERSEESSGKAHHQGLEQGIRPFGREQPDGHCDEYDGEGETSQTEALRDQEPSGAVPQGPGLVAHLLRQAHVLTPMEEVRQHGDEDEHGNGAGAQPYDADRAFTFLFIPFVPESQVCHFFFL